MAEAGTLRTVPERPGGALPGRGVVDRRDARARWSPTGLGRRWATSAFRVHSKVRPWSGTFADVDRAARALAGAPRGPRRRARRRRRVPAAELGRGRHHLLGRGLPRCGRRARRPLLRRQGGRLHPRRHRRPTSSSPPTASATPTTSRSTTALLADRPDPRWLVVGDTPAADLPGRAAAVRRPARRRPARRPVAGRPRRAGAHRLHVGHDPRPQGRHPLPPHDRLRDPPARPHVPDGGPPQITGAPVGHFIGMLNAFLVPLLRDRPGQPGRRVGSRRGAAPDARRGPRRGRRRHLLPHQPARPPRLHRRAPRPDALRRPRRLDRCPSRSPSGPTRSGIKAFRSYGSTEHPSITGCLLDDPEEKRLTTDGHALPGVEIRLDERRRDLQPRPRLLHRLHRPRR